MADDDPSWLTAGVAPEVGPEPKPEPDPGVCISGSGPCPGSNCGKC